MGQQRHVLCNNDSGAAFKGTGNVIATIREPEGHCDENSPGVCALGVDLDRGDRDLVHPAFTADGQSVDLAHQARELCFTQLYL